MSSQMLKNLLFFSLIIGFTGIPLASQASPQLLAQVDAVQVGMGETFTLTITLTGLAQSHFNNSQTPDPTPLSKDFHILSRQQQYSLINRTLEMRWEYQLQPKRVGNLQIPSLSLTNNQQVLRSQPLTILVQQTAQASDNYRLETLVSNHAPYIQEPFLYTLQLYHNGNIKVTENVTIPKDGVIVEQLGQWQARQEMVNGQPMIVAAINYLVTPLRSGDLALEPAQVVIGEPIQRNRQRSLFSFGGTNYRPKTLVSEPVPLKVRPASRNSPIWLPLTDLQLSETWETDINVALPVGVPLIRTVKLLAVNMGAQALPDVTDFFANSTAFRINQPKPDTERKLMPDGKTPATSMTQSFSMTPLQTGTITIPAVKIPWWNINTHQLMWAELPAQTLNVVANPTLPSLTPQTVPNTMQPLSTTPQSIVVVRAQLSVWQHVALNTALVALLFALAYVWWSRFKQHAVTVQPTQATKGMTATQFKRQLAELDDLAAIKALLQMYAHQQWQLPPQTGLNQMLNYLAQHYSGVDKLQVVFNELDTALYSPQPQPLNLASWKTRCEQFLFGLAPKSVATASTLSASPTLNPV